MYSRKDLEKKRSSSRTKVSAKKQGYLAQWRVYSCYSVSALIVLLCLYEAFYKEDQIPGGGATYLFLAALAILFSVTIGRNSTQKTAKGKKKQKK